MPGTLGALALVLSLSLGAVVSNVEPQTDPRALDGVRLIAVAPAEQWAVVSIAPGGLELMSVGDELGTTGFRVVGIVPHRLVLEQSGRRATGLMAWLFVAEEGSTSLARFFSPQRPPPPALEVPSPPEAAENAHSLSASGAVQSPSGRHAEVPQ